MQPQKPQAHALDRCSDIRDSTISAWHQAGVPTEQLDQARQAAFTLINCLRGRCSAAGTVTDEAEDQVMEFDGSDEESRQMPSRASRDEELARSVRRHMTYKAPANSERTPHKHAP